ncbi:MAG: site-2 protease family protein [Candidatus Promineifilaceae bacterium]|nr:site-2 protease family protein [Candidatus Promineifilaceae bacterium]
MIGKGFRIGRLFGIKVTVDYSWLFIFLLVVWNLASVFGETHPDWALWLQITTAVVAALLFFGSVLAHELAHSLMAIAQGLPVRSITLFLFGGVSNIEREPPSPRAEFLIAIVGPVTSIVLGVLFLVLSGVGLALFRTDDMIFTMSQLGPLPTLLLWLGPINIILGIFNMVPGFPLDGGRVLRSILWALTNSLRTATRWAARIGQAIAWLLIITGIAMVFGIEVPFFGTGAIGGIWLAFIGWFLSNASQQSYRQVVIQDLLEDVPVRRIMRTAPPVVNADETLDRVVFQSVMGTDEHAFPVLDDNRVVGIVCLHDIRAVDRSRWPETLVSSVMTPAGDLVVTTPDEELDEALNKLQSGDLRQLPVTDNGKLVGMLRRQDIVRYLQLQSSAEEDQVLLAE